MIKSLGMAGIALALMASTALAQQQRYVAFGDSLSDNGNLFAVTGQPPAPYFNGRFSNGPTFVELLAGGTMNGFIPPQILTQPSQNVVNTASTNYAFGGARTDNLVAQPPGSGAQIAAYLARGGRFGASDIVTLWAGANDIFQGLTVAAANPATAQQTMTAISSSAAVNVSQQARQLATAGARTVVVMNLPGFGTLPQFAGTPAAQLAGFSSLTFNTILATSLQNAANTTPGANIVSVDVASVFAALQATPGAYGFSNATASCIATLACVANPAARDGFAFWDGVHPSAAGHRLIAAVVDQTVRAPLFGSVYAALGEIGLDDRRQGQARAFDRLDLARAGRPGVNTFSVNLFGGVLNGDGSLNRSSLRHNHFGVSVAMDRAITDQFAVSGAGAISLGSAKVGGTLSTDTFNAGFDLGAIYSAGPFFAKAGVGLGVTRFGDLTRDTVGPLNNTASNATAVNYNLGVEIGTQHRVGLFELSPRARLAWLGGSLSSISESGIVAPLSINSRSLSALLAGAELRATAHVVDTATQKVAVTALVGYERYLSYSGNDLAARLIGNTALPFRITTADPKGPGVILGLGVNATQASGWSFTADYRAAIGERSQVRHSGQIGVRASF